MPIIEFSEKDILRGKLVTPAWYRVKIEDVTEKLAKNGESTNWFIEGTVLYNADDGTKEFAGVPTPSGWLFNSGAKGFMIGFFAALGVDVKSGTRLELKNAIGKEIDVFFDNDLYEQRMVNKINHKYRVPKEVAVA